MKTLAKSFLQGCLVLVPTVVTAWAVYLVWVKLDALLPSRFFPGAGVLLALGFITGVGALFSNVVGRRLLRVTEQVIARVPIVRLLYSTLRDFVEAFVGEEKGFDRPAVVQLTEDGAVHGLGFITRDDLSDVGLPGQMAVYMPQAYALAGHVVVLPASRVRALDVDAGRFMALVVSGGVTTGRKPGTSEHPPPAAAVS